jgi:hypothetical protein
VLRREPYLSAAGLDQSADVPVKRLEKVAATPAFVLISAAGGPETITLDGEAVTTFEYSRDEGLLYIRFDNISAPRSLEVNFE